MIVRTCLLSACMIVVPGLALCSHHLPAGIRSALWQPLASQVHGWLGGGDGRPPQAARPPDAGAWRDDPAVAGPDRPSPAPAAAARERLAALGGVAIECRRLESDTDVHVASCRVPLDAGGQLHRLFQAPGATEDEAITALADTLEAWRDRLAAHSTDRHAASGVP